MGRTALFFCASRLAARLARTQAPPVPLSAPDARGCVQAEVHRVARAGALPVAPASIVGGPGAKERPPPDKLRVCVRTLRALVTFLRAVPHRIGGRQQWLYSALPR